jgi:hypothetical protein
MNEQNNLRIFDCLLQSSLTCAIVRGAFYQLGSAFCSAEHPPCSALPFQCLGMIVAAVERDGRDYRMTEWNK